MPFKLLKSSPLLIFCFIYESSKFLFLDGWNLSNLYRLFIQMSVDIAE